jgi:hypothetical protein
MPAQQAVPEESMAAPAQAEVVHAPAAEMPMLVAVAEPAVLAEPAAEMPVVHAEPEPVQAVSVPAPLRAEPAPPPAPVIAVEKALQESGLVMIQTDPSKVKPIEPMVEPRMMAAQLRPRRAPPPDTGPLQIVETKK